jgi:hypothetical protein
VSGPSAAGTVSHQMTLLMLRDGEKWELKAELGYDVREPFEVWLAFRDGSVEVLRWVLSRQLLSDGLEGAAGEMDVRVWPGRDPSVVFIQVSSPTGIATFEAPAGKVAAFLAATRRLAPEGSEPPPADLEEVLAKISAGGSPW